MKQTFKSQRIRSAKTRPQIKLLRERRRNAQQSYELKVEINNLRGALHMDRVLLAEQRRKLTELQRQIDDTKALLPRDCILGAAQTWARERTHFGERIQLAMCEEQAPLGPLSMDEGPLTSRTMPLDYLISMVDTDWLHNMIHCRLRMDNGREVAYGISRTVLLQIERQALVEKVHTEIAPQLTEKLLEAVIKDARGETMPRRIKW